MKTPRKPAPSLREPLSTTLLDEAAVGATELPPVEVAGLRVAAGLLAVAEALDRLTDWVRKTMEADHEDWLRAQAEKRAKKEAT